MVSDSIEQIILGYKRNFIRYSAISQKIWVNKRKRFSCSLRNSYFKSGLTTGLKNESFSKSIEKIRWGTREILNVQIRSKFRFYQRRHC
ncbi:hypothetical protein BpHYR1_041732 [Brachionus plicatilis]|uniref:Uncharacterized protein n=1 Tax=Brachionus plicatilis TaxID=10195 RepID=A0A3M7S7R0_BRAPC|nr:hypothetical protein BpHYR1_041732 [Brachionus plicatilis]